jgi:hypothetical protein
MSQRVALILTRTHYACTIGRVDFSAEPSVRIMRYGSSTLKSAVDLGEPIESGIEPPEILVPEELYAGRVHRIYSAGGTGKTFKALQLGRV